MANYSELPELVVHSIFQHVHAEYDLERVVPILGTCRQWRHVGLPIAYHTAYCISNVVRGGGIKQKTNMDLMKATYLGGFAKMIHIALPIGDDHIEGLLFNAPDVDYAKVFPNVTSLSIWKEHVENAAFLTQLAENLVGIYSNQLKTLSLFRVSVPNMTHFPEKLTKLKYCINSEDKISLPKINPLLMEELEILKIPDTGFGHILFNSVMKDGQVNLYNLRKLTLDHKEYWPCNIDPQTQQMQLPTFRCPNLRCLELYSDYCSLADLPQFEFPTHLKHIYSDIYTDDQLNQLSQLPFKSIGSLKINLFNDEFTDLFYQASNRLFGKLTNTKQAIVNIKGMDLDVKRLNWKNVTKLTFAKVRHNVLLSMISQIPAIEHIVVYDLVCIKDKNPNMIVASNCNLKNIDIFGCDIEENKEAMAEYIIKVLVGLPSLKRVGVYWTVRTEVAEMIKEAGKQHPHLLKVEVSDFNG